jgi:hypothetical protein
VKFAGYLVRFGTVGILGWPASGRIQTTGA